MFVSLTIQEITLQARKKWTSPGAKPWWVNRRIKREVLHRNVIYMTARGYHIWQVHEENNFSVVPENLATFWVQSI